MADVIGTLCRREGRERRPHRRPQARHRTRGAGPQARFEFRKDLFDGIKVWAVGGQVEQLGASRLDRVAHPDYFMARQIVHADRVARLEGGGEDLFDIGHEAGAIDRTIEDGGGGEVVGAERRNDRRGLPVAVRDFRHEAGPPATAAIPARQLCLQGRLVQEDEAGAVPLRGLRPPGLPGGPDIRSVLCGGV